MLKFFVLIFSLILRITFHPLLLDFLGIIVRPSNDKKFWIRVINLSTCKYITLKYMTNTNPFSVVYGFDI